MSIARNRDALCLMAGMICTLLCITFVLSRPFNGPLALQPEAFDHSVGVYASVDEVK